MGWDAEQIAALFRDPFYPMLHGLWQALGEAGVRDRIDAVFRPPRRLPVPDHGPRGAGRRRARSRSRSALDAGRGDAPWRRSITGNSAARWTIPYEEKHPRRQFAFVFNTNRCIGCQTCTMACKSTWTFSKGQEYMWWNNVESKPYGGYPQHWDAKLLAMLEAANPGGQSWNAATADGERSPTAPSRARRSSRPPPTHVGPEGPQVALGYLPTDAEWRHPNIHEDTAAGGQWAEGQIRRLGAAARAPRLVLPPGADLQPLHLSRLPRLLPAAGDLQAARGRHRPDRPGAVPRL